MLTLSFWQVDAFTLERYRGNAAAVVFEADELPAARMQEIAREMNLSETVFVCRAGRPDADYRSRIFTPRSEIPFAGHPTLAAAYALLESARVAPRDGWLRQECGIGVVPVAVGEEGGTRVFTMTQGRPEYRSSAGVDSARAAQMLGCRAEDVGPEPVEIVSTGLPWMIVPLRSLTALTGLQPEQALVARICRDRGAVGVTAFAEGASRPDCRYRLRSFAPGEGVPEDPVCGSGNGATAAFLAKHRLGAEAELAYRAEQGVELGRDGVVSVSCHRAAGVLTVRVGGSAVKVIEGTLLV